MRSLADTIREVTRKHLEENNGLLLGQAVSAVGWVNNTVPDVEGIVELPMTDVAGAGIAVGAAMVGRRPIFVIRFQDFLILNGSPLINYAAKSKELHGRGTPIFVRALAAEGIGPVHSGVLHSLFMHFPGFRVCAPMTPGEYQAAWDNFMTNDDPMIVSEHRDALPNTEEMEDQVNENAEITLFGISAPRLHLKAAAEMLQKDGIVCNTVHINWLKPFEPGNRCIEPLLKTGLGLVIDASFEICGAARSIAYDLTRSSGVPVHALGLTDNTKCLCPPFQNRYPDHQSIYSAALKVIEENNGKPFNGVNER
jgi:pyruvate/2-oxoglutarate/acetoin dehydrogenase E1 component